MIPPSMTKVQIGQPQRPSARLTNAMQTALRTVGGLTHAQGAGQIPGRPDAPVLIRVLNDTGMTLKQFAPAAIAANGPIVVPHRTAGVLDNADELAEATVLWLTVPDAVYDVGNFVIMAEDLADQEIGLAYAGGCCWARVNISSVDDWFADVQSSADELLTGSSGAGTILWKESGTGTGKLAFLRFGGSGGASGSGIIAVVRITGNTQDGTNKRWFYTFTEVEQTSLGFGGWTDKAGGLTGNCMNLIEDQNGTTGTFGNGVSATNLIGTFDIQPIPTGTRVALIKKTTIGIYDNYWFQLANGVDGACP